MDGTLGSGMRERGDGGVRVLCVDDEKGFGDMSAAQLERRFDRLTVSATTDPASVVELLEDGFDCVVSDYEMPEFDGLELLRRVRRAHPNLPFILHTGRGSEDVAMEAIEEGVTDYLRKDSGSAQYDILGNRVLNSVDRYRNREALEYSEERCRRLIDSSPHPISIVVGSEVVYANQAFVRLVDADSIDDVEGERYLEFVGERYRDDVRNLVSRVAEDSVSFDRREGAVSTLTGREIPVSVVTTPILYEGEKAVQVVFTEVR